VTIAIFFLLAALAAGVGQPPPTARSADGRVLAGAVVDVEGTVRWRPNRAADPVVLEPLSIGPRPLFAGESLKCDPGARVVIVIYGRQLTLDESLGWYPIPHVPGRRGMLVMPDYGEPGGRYLYVPKPPPWNVGP
jgi:hypothetical protein